MHLEKSKALVVLGGWGAADGSGNLALCWNPVLRVAGCLGKRSAQEGWVRLGEAGREGSNDFIFFFFLPGRISANHVNESGFKEL